MRRSKAIFTKLVVILLFSGQCLAATNEVEEAKQQNLPLQSDELVEAANIENPLVSLDDEHGRLYLSPYDPEHHLYPVSIIAIDGWQVSENIVEKDLRLAAGEHQMIVIPDFSNIEPKVVFMSNTWQEKTIAFTIANEQDIIVSARLMDSDKLIWEVQMYRVALPEELVIKNINNNN